MYSANTREDILSALDDYTSGIRVLPREWQGDHKIDPPPKKTKKLGDELEEIDEDRRWVGCLYELRPFLLQIVTTGTLG